MADKKQITTRIPAKLHRKVKAKAALEDRTISDIIEELLSKWVGGPPIIAKYDEDTGWSTIEEDEQTEPIQGDPATRS